MANESAGIERVDKAMREPVRQYGALVRELAGAGARSLTVFGALAAGSFDSKRHTVHSVLVVDRVDLSVLKQLSEHGTQLGKQNIAAPLVMTPEYIIASLDTFPLELIEIQQQHIVLFGEDHFGKLSFENGHVRLQSERELKVILIGLRQGLLAAAGREKMLESLATESGEALIRTLRGLLWLKGIKEAKPAAAVLEEMERILDRKVPGIRTALDPAASHGWAEFEHLYRDVEALGEAADAW